MITTTHARPSFQTAPNVHHLTKPVLCPRCSKLLGMAHGAQQTRALRGKHSCLSARRELLQPSTALPFN